MGLHSQSATKAHRNFYSVVKSTLKAVKQSESIAATPLNTVVERVVYNVLDKKYDNGGGSCQPKAKAAIFQRLQRSIYFCKA